MLNNKQKQSFLWEGYFSIFSIINVFASPTATKRQVKSNKHTAKRPSLLEYDKEVSKRMQLCNNHYANGIGLQLEERALLDTYSGLCAAADDFYLAIIENEENK